MSPLMAEACEKLRAWLRSEYNRIEAEMRAAGKTDDEIMRDLYGIDLDLLVSPLTDNFEVTHNLNQVWPPTGSRVLFGGGS